MRRRISRNTRGERGASAVEFALVVIPLLMVIAGIVNFGVVFAQQLSLDNAVRAGARAGVVDTGKDAHRRDDQPVELHRTSAKSQTSAFAVPFPTNPAGASGRPARAAPSAGTRSVGPWSPPSSSSRGRSRSVANDRHTRRVRRNSSASTSDPPADAPTARDERGATAILVALLAVFLVGLSAFTVDLGAGYVSNRNLQKAADAGALAGAQTLSEVPGLLQHGRVQHAALTAARVVATDVAKKNYPDASWTKTAVQRQVRRRQPRSLLVTLGNSGVTHQAASRASSVAPSTRHDRRAPPPPPSKWLPGQARMRPLAMCSTLLGLLRGPPATSYASGLSRQRPRPAAACRQAVRRLVDRRLPEERIELDERTGDRDQRGTAARRALGGARPGRVADDVVADGRADRRRALTAPIQSEDPA